MALSIISLIIAAPVPMEATEELGEKIRLEAVDIMNQMVSTCQSVFFFPLSETNLKQRFM